MLTHVCCVSFTLVCNRAAAFHSVCLGLDQICVSVRWLRIEFTTVRKGAALLPLFFIGISSIRVVCAVCFVFALACIGLHWFCIGFASGGIRFCCGVLVSQCAMSEVAEPLDIRRVLAAILCPARRAWVWQQERAGMQICIVSLYTWPGVGAHAMHRMQHMNLSWVNYSLI